MMTETVALSTDAIRLVLEECSEILYKISIQASVVPSVSVEKVVLNIHSSGCICIPSQDAEPPLQCSNRLENGNVCCSAQMPPPPCMHKPNATIIFKNCN